MPKNTRTPIGPPVQIARNNGYQIYQRSWDGQTHYHAKVGRIFHSTQSGQPTIATDFDIWSYDDFIKTSKAAKRHLDRLAISAQQQQAAQVNVQVATPQQAVAPAEHVIHAPGQTQQPAPPHSDWETPKQPLPPKPYPSKEYS